LTQPHSVTDLRTEDRQLHGAVHSYIIRTVCVRHLLQGNAGEHREDSSDG
jgi:hypothetical protein